MTTSVGIVGFRGYSGAELVRILARHPHVEPVLLEHRSDSDERPLPRKAGAPRRIAATAAAAKAEGLAVVFLATPPEVSMELTPGLLEAGAKVVDLSGAFRLRTPESIPALVQGRAHRSRAAGRSGLRAAGVLPRPDSPGAAGCQSRLLSDRRQPGHPAADRGGNRRYGGGDRLRCQIGRQRRGPQAEAQDELLRSHGELLRLLHPGPPPRARGAHELAASTKRSSASPRS